MEHVTQAVANQNPPRHSDWFMRRQGIGLANQHKYPHATGLVPGGHVTGQVDGQRSRVGRSHQQAGFPYSSGPKDPSLELMK